MSSAGRTVLRAWPLATALAGASLFAGMPSALAQQDSAQQQFNDIKSAIGLGQERAPIDFTERPPLVVPPTNTLPPPVTSSAQLPVLDPDEGSRRKALTDSRRPVPPTDPGAFASGRSARQYLVDPPAGMRDPDIVSSDREFDKSASAEKKASHRKHAKRKKAVPTEQAAQ